MMKSLIYQLFAFSILGLLGCHGQLDQDFESVQRQCGASWVKERPDFDFPLILDENGQRLSADQAIAYWLGPRNAEAQTLDVSPSGCLAVPKNVGDGWVLLGNRSTGAANSFRSQGQAPLQLTPKQNLKLNLLCPTGGIHSPTQAQVRMSLSLDGKALTPEQSQSILRLYKINLNFQRRESRERVAEFALADWSRSDEPLALKLLENPRPTDPDNSVLTVTQLFATPGPYFAALQWSDVFGTKFALESPGICPIEIDRQAPARPSLDQATADDDMIYLQEGARMPLGSGAGETLHFQIARMAAQQLEKRWSALSPAEQEGEVFQSGEIPPVERPGLYRLRAYTEDQAGNRSPMYEQAVRVLERPVYNPGLSDGWQLMQADSARPHRLVGPHWNGVTHVLAEADLDGVGAQRIRDTDLPISIYPEALNPWQTLRSVKGRFGLGELSGEQICFYRPAVIVDGALRGAAHMQCFGWKDQRWQMLFDQDILLSADEDIIASDMDVNGITDLFFHNRAVGLIRILTFSKDQLAINPGLHGENLGAFGNSRGKAILPISPALQEGGVEQLYLMFDPVTNGGICFGVQPWSKKIMESMKITQGSFWSELQGFDHPLAKTDFFFPKLRGSAVRLTTGPDWRGTTAAELLYAWNDQTRHLTAWSYGGCWRSYEEIDTDGLPDLYGRQFAFFKTLEQGKPVFKALIYPLNSVGADAWELYRLDGQSWTLQSMVENPSNARANLQVAWLDQSEAPRAFGTLSVAQGDPLPFILQPAWVGYHRWTALKQKTGTETPGPWQTGPLPYAQTLGTWRLELLAQKADAPAPTSTTPPTLRRVVSVIPRTATSRATLSGLGAILQPEAKTDLVRITPHPLSTRAGFLQWTVQTLQNPSTSTLVELEQPWTWNEGYSFFQQQNLRVITGRFGLADGNPEAVCYIRLDKYPVQARIACLGMLEKKWVWLEKNGRADIFAGQDIQTLDLNADGLGPVTHVLTVTPTKASTRIGRWDRINATLNFLPVTCAGGRGYDSWNCTYERMRPSGPAYPFVIREPLGGVDTLMSGYPDDIEAYRNSSFHVYGALVPGAHSYDFNNGYSYWNWSMIEPFRSLWFNVEFDGKDFLYGRRFLRSQVIPLHLSGPSNFLRVTLPDRTEEDFRLMRYIHGDDPSCGFCIIHNEDRSHRDVEFLIHDLDVATVTTRSYQDANQRVQDIMVLTPVDADQGLAVYRWQCDQANSCKWQTLTRLAPVL